MLLPSILTLILVVTLPFGTRSYYGIKRTVVQAQFSTAYCGRKEPMNRFRIYLVPVNSITAAFAAFCFVSKTSERFGHCIYRGTKLQRR